MRGRKFYLTHLSGTEALCSDFSYRLEVGSYEQLTTEDIEKLIGKPVTVDIGYLDRNSKPAGRLIHAIVYKVEDLGMRHIQPFPGIWRYRFEIGSWFRKLSFIKDCRIFQKGGNHSMSIISELLTELGCRDFKDQTGGEFPKRELSVMYNETMENYIRRLCDEDGILFTFKHHNNRHELIFTTDSDSLPEIPDSSWGYYDGVKQFCRDVSYIPIRDVTVASYDWENPPVKNVFGNTGMTNSTLKNYIYPGHFKKRADGDAKARRYSENLKNQAVRYFGQSTMRVFAAGHRFHLNAPMLPDLHGKPFLIQQLSIEATNDSYTNEFIALSAKEPYIHRDETVQKPVIEGIQTAMVVGPGGDGKIQADKRGCVKVRFHWDHHSPEGAAHTSAFVRVSQSAAGSQRGFLFTPRVGEEVTVMFENGNPDRPIITGAVYSNNRQPPTSPDSYPFSGIIKSGDGSDANRITLNDKPGSEKLEVQAENDLNIKVGGNLNVKVEDDIFIQADSVNIIVRNNVCVETGGNILSLSLKGIDNTAGASINNLAVGGIVNIAGGKVSNKAAQTITNTAILSADNTSGGGIANASKTLMANTCLKTVANIGKTVQTNAALGIINTSTGGGIMQDGKEVQSEALMQKTSISETSSTETDQYKVKGLVSKMN